MDELKQEREAFEALVTDLEEAAQCCECSVPHKTDAQWVALMSWYDARTPSPVQQEADHIVDANKLIAQKDGAYEERNRCVAALAKLSIGAGYKAGIAKTAIEGWSEDWHGCVYIDLPTGQVSWHFHDSHAHLFRELPLYAGAWDGHDTPEKYRRVDALSAPQGKQEAVAAAMCPECVPYRLCVCAAKAGEAG